MSSDSDSQAATSSKPVPGEKMSDDVRFTPGGPGASGRVQWLFFPVAADSGRHDRYLSTTSARFAERSLYSAEISA
jgi:hypothetical protein